MLDTYSGEARRRWPYNARGPRQVENLAGLSLTSLYLCNEASGNLVDCIGGQTLTAGGTPVYGDTSGSQRKRGVAFNSTSDGFQADVHDLDTRSFVMFAVVYFSSTPDTTIFGRLNAAGAEGAFVGVATPASGTLRAVIRDSGAGELALAPAVDVRTKLCCIVLQGDRGATPTGRFLIKPHGEAAVEQTGSLAGLVSLSGLNQGFGLCNFMPTVISQTGGFTCYLLGVALDEQCEGDTIPTRIAERLMR